MAYKNKKVVTILFVFSGVSSAGHTKKFTQQ